MLRRLRFALWVAVVLAAGGTGAVWAWQTQGRPAPGDPRIPLPLRAMTWRLIDQAGREVRPADWIGHPTMVFFGFTWCPDVCPTTLADIAAWLAELGEPADDVRAVLVTVDPERDTPDVLANYLSWSTDPEFVGLTGTPAEVAAAAAEFRAVYERVPQGDGYTMNHTAGVLLYRPDGRFTGIIDFHEDHRMAVPKIERILRTAPGDEED